MPKLRLMWPVDRDGYEIVKREPSVPPTPKQPPHVASQAVKDAWKQKNKQEARAWRKTQTIITANPGSWVVRKGGPLRFKNVLAIDGLLFQLGETPTTEKGVLDFAS